MSTRPISSTPPAEAVARQAPSGRDVVLAAVVGAVGATVAAFLVALVAIALGAPDDAQQLQPSAFIPFAVFGAVVGALGWSIVLRRSSSPRRLLPRLVAGVMLVLFLPDVLIAASGSATWGTAVALMVMHVVVAAVLVPVYARFMPPRD